MKILILIFFFEIKESKITRGHNYTLVKKQSRLDVRKYSFSQRTINVWNNLSTDCIVCVPSQTQGVQWYGGSPSHRSCVASAFHAPRRCASATSW